jgi:hypothetical protein
MQEGWERPTAEEGGEAKFEPQKIKEPVMIWHKPIG